MRQPDSAEVDALARLAKSPDGVKFRSYLATELQAQLEALVSTSVDLVQRQQGKALAFSEILRLLSQCVEVADKQQRKSERDYAGRY